MSRNHKKSLKIALMIALFIGALGAAYDAITHSDFYAELERLNMDNHQH